MKVSRKNAAGQSGALRKGTTNTAAQKVDLAAIDKLLKTAASLMKGSSKLNRDAFEYLRRLRVAVRFAMSGSEAVESQSHFAPCKWNERTHRSESPVDFIRREYAPLLERGSLSRADIRRLDRPLYAALYQWIAKNGELPRDIDLPRLKEANDRKLAIVGKVKPPRRLLRVSELSPTEREHLRLYKLAQKRRR